MKLTKIITKLEEHVENITDESYTNGYADGCNDGYDNGVNWERKRIIDLFTMCSQQELVSGSASKAKAFAMAAAMVDNANTDWDSLPLQEEYF